MCGISVSDLWDAAGVEAAQRRGRLSVGASLIVLMDVEWRMVAQRHRFKDVIVRGRAKTRQEGCTHEAPDRYWSVAV